MFCSNCGEKAAGNFCHKCGARILTAAPSSDVPPAIPASPAVLADWRDETRYNVLLCFEEVRKRIDASAALAKKKWTADDFMGVADKVYKPMVGVSLKTMVSIALPIYTKLGIKKTKAVERSFIQPAGEVTVAILCCLAKNGQTLKEVHEASDGCVIEAAVPSDFWAMEGTLVVTVHKRERETAIEVVVTFPGQWYAWGKENTVLEAFFDGLDFRSSTAFRRAA